MTTLTDPKLDKAIKSFMKRFGDNKEYTSHLTGPNYKSRMGFTIKTVVEITDRLCYIAYLVNQELLPKGTELERLAKSGVDWAQEDLSQGIYFKIIPEARLALEESFKDTIEILPTIEKYTPLLSSKVVRDAFKGAPNRGWAMALILYYSSKSLGDSAVHLINYGVPMAGVNQRQRMPSQVVFAMLFNFISARAGNQESIQNVSNLARTSSISVQALEEITIDKAYAELVRASDAP